MYQFITIKVEKNRFENAKVLKTASRNMAKQINMRETWIVIRIDKIIEAIAKQIVM